MDISDIKEELIVKIVSETENYLQDKRIPVILTLISLFSGGHLLIEDLPGVGKTTLAIAIAKIFGFTFGRIQCTPDLLPSDITGINIFSNKKSVFEFQKGPIFNNIVLIDEINRTTQKTQSAFLEAMEEEQVTIDTKTFPLPTPFFVIATQNPTEHYGTFPLPDSQMDRFIMNISIGYPDRNSELDILKTGSIRKNLSYIKPVLRKEDFFEIIKKISSIYASEKALNYIVDIVNSTRNNKYIITGISPRGSLALLSCAKTFAYFKSRDYITFDDIKQLAPYTLSHRIILKEEYSSLKKRDIIEEIVRDIDIPV